MFCFINMLRSHLTQVRGLKLKYAKHHCSNDEVAPHAGAWIEIQILQFMRQMKLVAPHAGAWIEI